MDPYRPRETGNLPPSPPQTGVMAALALIGDRGSCEVGADPARIRAGPATGGSSLRRGAFSVYKNLAAPPTLRVEAEESSIPSGGGPTTHGIFRHHGRIIGCVYGLLTELDTDGATGSDTLGALGARCHWVRGWSLTDVRTSVPDTCPATEVDTNPDNWQIWVWAGYA